MTFIKRQAPWNKGTKGVMKSNKTSFKKGSIPWNKDTKGTMKPNSGSFKKGQKSINWKSVGTITIRKDKNWKMRKWIKIKEPNVWELLAVYNWKKYRGKIKKGYIIHHKNFNHFDDTIRNLAMITRGEHINIHREYCKIAEARLRAVQKTLL